MFSSSFLRLQFYWILSIFSLTKNCHCCCYQVLCHLFLDGAFANRNKICRFIDSHRSVLCNHHSTISCRRERERLLFSLESSKGEEEPGSGEVQQLLMISESLTRRKYLWFASSFTTLIAQKPNPNLVQGIQGSGMSFLDWIVFKDACE